MSYTSLNFLGNVTSYLSVPFASLSFGTGDFTIEWWQYQTLAIDFPRIFAIGSYPATKIGVSIEGGTFYFWSDNNYIFSYNLPTITNIWTHFAIVRQSGNVTIYFNGTPLTGSPFSDTTDYSFNENLVIGNETTLAPTSSFSGQLYNFMWLIGTAKYTGPFTPSTNVPSNPGAYALVLNGSFTGGSQGGSVTNNNVAPSSNVPTPPPPPPPPRPTIVYPRRISSTSYGQFWFGGSTFPGFLYKKNTAGGARRSTKFNPGGNTTCNNSTYLYNKYKPGAGGVGASSMSNRRAKNRLATVCGPQKCFPCYTTLGQYSNYTHNPNGFIPCPPPIYISSGSYLFSKNNTTSGGFPVGGPVDKDMRNSDYTEEFDPADSPEYFPGMAPFTDENIVAGDKDPSDRLIASEWRDWGDDVFDNWGFFYLYDVEQGKYYFPLISPQNEDDGKIFTQTFNAFGRVFTIKQGYPVQGIFKFDISVNDNKPFKFGAYGDMEAEDVTNLTHSYSKSSTNLTLYYLRKAEQEDDVEILYSYFVPKKVSENNNQTYNFYKRTQFTDDNSLMSKVVTNGLIVYFSKTNDVKEWVVNDLGIQS
jgi:hypothetical protein